MARSAKESYCIGFDLGGTKMMAKLFNNNFETLARQRKKTKGHEGVEAGVARMADVIQATLDEADIKASKLGAIGIGCPGPLDLDKGILLELPNLGWSNVQIRKKLEKTFSCPVVLSNDVDAGVYGEYRFGAAMDAHCAVGVFPGTGIGGGCIYEGKILRGKKSSCMEIGHMQVLPEGPLCGCGRRGCLEAVASRLAVSSAAVAAAYRGEAPYLLEDKGMDLSNIKSGTLASAIREGDKSVESIVRQAAQWLGVGVGNVVNLLGPDVVVLGGGMVEAMPDIFLEETTAMAKARAMPSFKNTFKVVTADLGDEATAMGAASWAFDSMAG